MRKTISIFLILCLCPFVFPVLGSTADNSDNMIRVKAEDGRLLGDLTNAEMMNASGDKYYITNMAYGSENMDTFSVDETLAFDSDSDGIAENYPQIVELITEADGTKSIHLNAPVAQKKAINMYMPTIKFDEVYKKDYTYKLKFKAKWLKKDVKGEDGSTANFAYTVRCYASDGTYKNTTIKYLSKTSNYASYEVDVPASLLENAVRMTGLFYKGSSNSAQDVYLTDFEWYVEKIDIVTVTAGQGGTVSEEKLSAKDGETVSVTITPDEGYYIENVTFNGNSVHTNVYDELIYTTPSLSADAVIHVSFAKDERKPEIPWAYQDSVFTDNGNVTIDGQVITGPKGIVFAKILDSSSGYTLNEFGMEFAVDQTALENGEGKACKALKSLSSLGNYGICFYGNFKQGKLYYARPYAIYIKGEESIKLTGSTISFIPNP